MAKNIRKSDWIQTYTDKLFYPIEPISKDIEILDIAHALSNLCRFTGHTNQFYSVAQHSVIVCNQCSITAKKFALLHDASEAYLQDIPRPLKHHYGFDEYRLIEGKLQRMIYRKFIGVLPNKSQFDCIKIADDRTLITEGRDLMPDFTKWNMFGLVEPYGFNIEPVLPIKAREMFLEKYYDLFQ
jgi:uncharacterized protein